MRQGCPPASGLQESFRVFFPDCIPYERLAYLHILLSVLRSLLFFISGRIMSGSQEIRDNRMNVGLFRHWITEWQSENDNKLPSEILAEAALFW